LNENKKPGHRVCEYSEKATDGFVNWGQHCDKYAAAAAYMTVAVSIGLTREQLEHALAVIAKTIKERDKRKAKKEPHQL
jgi:hypothetical protein